jgi:uncharacterized protein with HEPN domain
VKDDQVYLEHIQECLDWIARFTSEGEAAFRADRKTQSATLRELQTLAEATQRLTPEIKARHPEVAWQAIAGFRNVLVHNYLGINLSRVWEIIQRDLPALATAAKAMQEESGSTEA